MSGERCTILRYVETTARVIADSISPDGNRLTTLEVTLHRFVLAEFNTHRVFSRNSASSRAIPVEKQLKRVIESPAFPLEWPSEQPGMQGGSTLTGWDLEVAQDAYKLAQESATAIIESYIDVVRAEYPNVDKEELKSHLLHKSLLNRLLEPFMWHTIICTSTSWDNFFGLRCNPMAQPEIRVAAELMRDAYDESYAELIQYGDWHLPFIQKDEWELDTDLLCKLSAARCARVSYLTHEGVRDHEKDVELYERLISADPPHASPLEHVATPAILPNNAWGNFTGWHQLRHVVGK